MDNGMLVQLLGNSEFNILSNPRTSSSMFHNFVLYCVLVLTWAVSNETLTLFLSKILHALGA